MGLLQHLLLQRLFLNLFVYESLSMLIAKARIALIYCSSKSLKKVSRTVHTCAYIKLVLKKEKLKRGS